MSFRLKTILGIALIEILMLGMLLHFGLRLIDKNGSDELVKRSHGMTELFAHAMQNAVLSTDLATLQGAAEEFDRNPEVGYVRILAANRVLAQSGDAALLQKPFREDESIESAASDQLLDSEAIIRIGQQEVGRVQVGFSIASHQELMAAARQGGFSLALLEIVLTALMSLLLGTYLTRQLAMLGKATQAISSGDLGYQIPVSSQDELARTAHAFNQMSRELEISHQLMSEALEHEKASAEALKQRERDLLQKQQVLDAINRLQECFIANMGRQALFDEALQILLNLTGARFGLLAEYQPQENRLHILALSDISWNESSQAIYQRHLAGEPIYFDDMHNLLGQPVITRQPILHNQPLADSARTPHGHPPLDNYLGMPIILGNEVIGSVALANHPEGFSAQQLALLGPLLRTCGQLLLALKSRAALDLAQQLLQEREQYLHSIVETSTDGMLMLDQHGRILSANQAVRQIFRREQADLLQHHIANLLAEDYQDDLRLTLARVGEDQDSLLNGRLLEVYALRDQHERFPVELAITRLSQQEEQHFNVVLRDITERKATEAQIRQLGSELKTILDLSPDGYLSYNAQQRVTMANPALLAMLGLDDSSLLPRDVAGLDQLLMNASHDPAAYQAISQLEDGATDSITLIKPHRQVLKRSLRLQQTERGRRNGGILYLRDITRETDLDRMKSEFLSTAAHELRTPVANILGFAELITQRQFDEETRQDLLDTIHRQSRHLVSLVNQLLDLARLEAKAGKDFNIQPHDFTSWLRAYLATFPTPAGRQPPQLPEFIPAAEVLLDSEKFTMALNNILFNAYKYSPEHGLVSLSLQLRQAENGHPPRLGLSISDQGPGIAPHLQQKVFDRFFRVDSARSTPGSGLGLALVREIMQNLHGEVSLSSEHGKGSTFTLWLPLSSH